MSFVEWQVLILSMLPVTELRATIPLALALGVAPFKAYLLAVLGNLIPIVPILLLLEPLSLWLRRFPAVGSIFQKILARTRRKGAQVQKYGILGLLFFVAVPLPGTGAWTGAFLAWLLGLNIMLSVIAISAGVIMAGILVMLASLGVVKMALIYELEYIFAFFVLLLFIYAWYKRRGR